MKKTKNIYGYPFPPETKVEFVIKDNRAHTGAFKGAIDFAVKLKTPVIAPLNGKVVEVVDSNDKFGTTEEFTTYTNFITIKHTNDELSQLVHLKKGSALVKVGDKVKKGDLIALTGNSGWMTGPHLHIFVFKLISYGAKFKGLAIRFDKKL